MSCRCRYSVCNPDAFCSPDVRWTHTRILVARGPYVEPAGRHNLGRMDHTCPECGALHWTDERVQKTGSTKLHPLFGRCCGDGKICLPAPPPRPICSNGCSRLRQPKHASSASTSANTTRRCPSRLSGSRLTTASIEVVVDLRCSRFTVNSITGSALSSLRVASHRSMPSYTSLTLLRHQATAWRGTVTWTPT